MIEQELRAFVGTRERLPTQREFKDADQWNLYKAMHKAGGAPHWAARLGLSARARGDRHWTDDRIEETLRRYVAGHGKFPTVREMRAAGLGALASAVCRSGGTPVWRQRLQNIG